MTKISVTYHMDEGDLTVEQEFDNVRDAVVWLYSNLLGWCVDNDITVAIDGAPMENM